MYFFLYNRRVGKNIFHTIYLTTRNLFLIGRGGIDKKRFKTTFLFCILKEDTSSFPKKINDFLKEVIFSVEHIR